MGKRHKPEEIIGKLREAEIVLAQVGVTTLYITPASPWEKWLQRVLQWVPSR